MEVTTMFFIKLMVVLLASFIYETHQSSEEDVEIIGGDVISIKEAPFMAGLFVTSGILKDAHNCGGSIIHKYFILTAGHCCADWNPDMIKIRVGKDNTDSETKVYDIEKLHVHEDYDVENDICVIKLTKAIDFSDNVVPIKLADQNNDIKIGTVANVTGWGTTNDQGPGSKELRQVSVSIVPMEQCEKTLNRAPTSGDLCAGKAGKSVCHGDSGGPLTSNGLQYGVVSRGRHKCTEHPAIYTRVAAYVPWIENIINSYVGLYELPLN